MLMINATQDALTESAVEPSDKPCYHRCNMITNCAQASPAPSGPQHSPQRILQGLGTKDGGSAKETEMPAPAELLEVTPQVLDLMLHVALLR